ncbi:COMM domain-containing protein 2 isoform X1 [Cherax quadricarinatus]|nr:COMM domain-containing protein 2-like isoform X1 [Cherax quadricarinatus]
MVPPLSQEHKSQLSLLVKQDAAVLNDFCGLAAQFVKHGVHPKVFASAAHKLGVLPSQVEDAIRALVFLLSHSTQATATKMEFQDLITTLGFTEAAVNVLTDAYTDNEGELKEYLKKMGVQIPHYHNLEWRFDILVGSRALSHIAEPLITLQLSLDTHTCPGSQTNEDDGGGKQSEPVYDKLLLQTDPNNLVHMTSVLEEALHEARTHHSRRIHRYIK